MLRALEHTPHYVQLDNDRARLTLGRRVVICWDGAIYTGVHRWTRHKKVWGDWSLCYIELHEAQD